MKLLVRTLALLCCLLATALHAEDGVADLAIGAPAPSFSLPGIDGKTHTLAEYQDGKVLVIFFTSNHCPTSHGAADRLKSFLAEFRPQGMTFVAINPNHPDGLSPDELGYSKYNDGFEDMKKYAAEEKFDFPYLYDGETQATAKAYGCLATPHVFVFDAERKLRYKGHFDDSRYGGDDSTVRSPDTRNAVKALLAGQPVPVPITKPHGCSTKWRTKQTEITTRVEKWDQTPVVLEPIDAGGVAALRKNGTNKLRLINVWATWCAPCRAEFPELVFTARKFGLRDFDFISLSADDLGDLNRAKAFLQSRKAGLSPRMLKSVQAEGRTTNHYIFSGPTPDALLQALDPQGAGPLPHTILVNSQGEIIWRHSGMVKGEELRVRILETLGNYYRP